jgi:hypothetical protein
MQKSEFFQQGAQRERSTIMSFEQMVNHMRPKIGQTLVSSENLEHIRRVASRLPTKVAYYFGFETKLLSDQAHSDFAFNLSNDGLTWMSRTDSPWPHIRQFCALWGESGEPPYSDGSAVWLEFDVSGGLREEREPSLFFALRDSQSSIRSVWGKSSRPPEWICQTLIPTAWGRLMSPPLEQNLLHAIEVCPDGVDFLQIGLMLSRDIQALRLCIFGVMSEEVFPFLHRVGWRGEESRLAQVLERYSPFADSLCLHLDIGESIFPTLGVEMLYHAKDDPWNYQPDSETRWKLLFDRLVDDGLCLASKRDALLAWPSRTAFKLPFIEMLIAAASFDQTPHAPSVLLDGVLVTGLGHIKFSLSPAGETNAKAYFGARYDQGMEG